LTDLEVFLYGDEDASSIEADTILTSPSWFTDNHHHRRKLKRGGGSSSKSSSSSRSRTSYGNCYGDRCDDTGGSVSIAIIIASIVGGFCVICLFYYLITYCLARKDKADRKKRKKRNWVHPDGDVSDAKEPVVVILPQNYGDTSISADFTVETDISHHSSLNLVVPPPPVIKSDLSLNAANSSSASGVYTMGAAQFMNSEASAVN